MNSRIFCTAVICSLAASSFLFAQPCRPVKFLRLDAPFQDLSVSSSATAGVSLPGDSDFDTDNGLNMAKTVQVSATDSVPDRGSASGTAGADCLTTTPADPAGLMLAELFNDHIGSAVSACQNDLDPILDAQQVFSASGSGTSFGAATLQYLVQNLGVPADQEDCVYTARFTIDVQCLFDLTNGAVYDHNYQITVRLYEDVDSLGNSLNSELIMLFRPIWDQDTEQFSITRLFNCETELKDPINGFTEDILDSIEVPGPSYEYMTTDANGGPKHLEFLVSPGNVIEVSVSYRTDVTAPSTCPNGFAISSSGSYSFEGAMSLDINDKVLLGDANCDGSVDILDVAPFVDIILDGGYKESADINRDCEVNHLDISPFVDVLNRDCT